MPLLTMIVQAAENSLGRYSLVKNAAKCTNGSNAKAALQGLKGQRTAALGCLCRSLLCKPVSQVI